MYIPFLIFTIYFADLFDVRAMSSRRDIWLTIPTSNCAGGSIEKRWSSNCLAICGRTSKVVSYCLRLIKWATMESQMFARSKLLIQTYFTYKIYHVFVGIETGYQNHSHLNYVCSLFTTLIEHYWTKHNQQRHNDTGGGSQLRERCCWDNGRCRKSTAIYNPCLVYWLAYVEVYIKWNWYRSSLLVLYCYFRPHAHIHVCLYIAT